MGPLVPRGDASVHVMSTEGDISPAKFYAQLIPFNKNSVKIYLNLYSHLLQRIRNNAQNAHLWGIEPF